ncbi:ABC transporter ATP-binding protein [Novipirellula sp.]|uniref:ABC transporter ATP-binding protein n=1 Tax=Novipirellula sp. TaxID=2795430 RepID=UPI003566EF62
MPTAIRFENVSKQYRLGEVGTGTLSHDLHRAMARALGKPDPFAQVGATNDREQKQNHKPEGILSRISPRSSNKATGTDYVWALKDVSLDVQQGEILGIIGRNGAGKSTLLKLLSRVTAPTHGRIKTKGRIASLLEVGTGFHPELTGRENIYLNGAILGMRRHEIAKQLDDIVDFSGCAMYIDTPVKRYSSGMMVRLGFAVAAHLQCEILVVDEVLAVGDAEFQKKCVAKMRDVAGDGRTIFFVSHNMAAVRSLCQRAVTLIKGSIQDDGEPSDVVIRYLSHEASHASTPLEDRADRGGDGSVRIKSLTIESANSGKTITSTCPLKITLQYTSSGQINHPKVMIGIYDENDNGIYGFDSDVTGGLPNTLPERGRIHCLSKPINLTAGRCYVNVAFFANGTLADHVINADIIDIEASDFFGNGRTIPRNWMTGLLQHEWHLGEE